MNEDLPGTAIITGVVSVVFLLLKSAVSLVVQVVKDLKSLNPSPPPGAPTHIPMDKTPVIPMDGLYIDPITGHAQVKPPWQPSRDDVEGAIETIRKLPEVLLERLDNIEHRLDQMFRLVEDLYRWHNRRDEQDRFKWDNAAILEQFSLVQRLLQDTLRKLEHIESFASRQGRSTPFDPRDPTR